MFTKHAFLFVTLLFLFWNNEKVSAMTPDMAEAVMKHQKEFLVNATECKAKTGATEEDILIFLSRKKLPETRTGACLIACMLEKMQLMKNGKYMEDTPQMIAHFILGPGDMVAELIGDVSKACAKTIMADDDDCKTAMKISECGMQYIKKFREVAKKT